MDAQTNLFCEVAGHQLAYLRRGELDNQHVMEIKSELQGLKLPVLVIRGDADEYLSFAISERLHREIPNSRLIRIQTAGHFIQEGEPERLVDIIIRFFEETSREER